MNRFSPYQKQLNFVLPTDAGDWYIRGGVSYQIDRGGDVVNWVVPKGVSSMILPC